MEKRKLLSNIRDPDEVNDNLTRGLAVGGEKVYVTYCRSCHQKDGRGASGRFPPLAGTWVTGDKAKLIGIIVGGMEGQIEVNGESYNDVMPKHQFLSDEEVANVLTYVRQNFGNKASPVTVDEVRDVRAARKK